MKKISVYLAGLGVAALAVTGCGKDSNPAQPSGSTTTTTTTTVTFAQLQRDIFTPSCESCHTDNGRSPAGNLNLKSGAAYPNLVSQASSAKSGATRVIPGNASGSYLVQKLEGASDIVGVRMPRNGPPYLSDAQVQLVRQWIAAGAPNN